MSSSKVVAFVDELNEATVLRPKNQEAVQCPGVHKRPILGTEMLKKIPANARGRRALLELTDA